MGSVAYRDATSAMVVAVASRAASRFQAPKAGVWKICRVLRVTAVGSQEHGAKPLRCTTRGKLRRPP